MRWRIEKEVIDGKGQFICGDKKCPVKDGLKSWEVNFAYNEHGERKNALVKLRKYSMSGWLSIQFFDYFRSMSRLFLQAKLSPQVSLLILNFHQ
jgi:hypothetical protein